jgi:hypothetical protein
MNGRAYDYQLGRFLSVDPIIQFPTNSQSLNPYSYLMNSPLGGVDPSGYACEAIEGGVQCNFEADVLGSRIKTDITATVKGNDLSFSGSLVVGSDTLVSGSGMAKLGLAITGGGADRMARIDGNRGQAGVPNSPKGNPAGKDPGVHRAWAPPLEWTLPNWDSPWTWAVAPAAFVHEQIMRDTGRTTAAFYALLDPYGAAMDPVTGATVAGVDAWEQRVSTTLSVASGIAGGAMVSSAASYRGFVAGTNRSGEITSRAKFWKRTVQETWDDAPVGPNGGRLCARCRIAEAMVPPFAGRARDWVVGHVRAWTKRLFPKGTTRREVIENYQKGVQLECPRCSREYSNRE